VDSLDPSAAVEVTGLVKRYGARTVVDGLDLRAERGAITALLGPNGAGKTTTIEICEGFRTRDAGTVRVLGLDPQRDGAALRPRIGIMLQSGGIYPTARPLEVLRLYASFARSPLDPQDLLDTLGLRDVVKTPYRRLSGGQQQRLSLALALVHRPELVVLDEPTAGLDPQARHTTWTIIERLREDGVSVLLTTHYIEEAERLADHVVIIDAGRVVASGAPSDLARSIGPSQLRFRARPGLDLELLLKALPEGTKASEAKGGRYVIEGEVGPELLAAVTAWCASQDVLAEDLRIDRRSLEEAFLDLTGKEPRP
jgi:ABC-2 type transport system ATP-binding protein